MAQVEYIRSYGDNVLRGGDFPLSINALGGNLLVLLASYYCSASSNISAVTFNGKALRHGASSGSSNYYARSFYLWYPDQGTYTTTVTYAGSSPFISVWILGNVDFIETHAEYIVNPGGKAGWTPGTLIGDITCSISSGASGAACEFDQNPIRSWVEYSLGYTKSCAVRATGLSINDDYLAAPGGGGQLNFAGVRCRGMKSGSILL